LEVEYCARKSPLDAGEWENEQINKNDMNKKSTNNSDQDAVKSKHLTDDEIKQIVAKSKSGLRYTVDYYLLDYMKHCLLEDGQLESSIQKLQSALDHIDNKEVKKGVEDVIENLNCVQKEYTEYVEDMRTMIDGGYPAPRGEGL
jgi:hypothetical protein